jgi:hypothetical protein
MNNQPGIDQLLIRSALDADLRRRLRECPDDVFREFDLSPEQQEILRQPDHRLLPLLGAALARQTPPSAAATAEAPAAQPHVVVQAHALPDISLALTLVPCAQHENGQFKGFAYAVWVSHLPPGADPVTLPPPAGAALPGTPCSPLHAVISVSAVQLQDAAGHPQVGLWASLRQSSNVPAPPAVEAAGKPDASPFGTELQAPPVRAAVAAVRSAAPEERYGCLISLLGVLGSGEVR